MWAYLHVLSLRRLLRPRYQELLQTQRLEFEDILARRLREQEHALTTQFQQAVADKEASVQTLLQTALDTQQAEHENDKKAFEQLKAAEIAAQLEQDFGQKLEQYKAGVAQELERKVATLRELGKQLASLESALAASKSSREGSVKAHKLSATALALSQKLETSQPAGTELLALQAAAGEKGVIPAALKTIPTAVYSQGAATVPELQARFDDVYRQCRRAALVPEGRPGLEGQLAGIVFSSLKYPPGPDDPAPEDQPDHPEYVLVRAKRHVQLGELERAVEQLEKLQGQVAFTASDWKTSALHRVAVEKALKVIKLECALVNESLVE
jgi:MICOS complex subunit MIC60